MWLLGRLAPDHKMIADFRKDNGLALRKVCAGFVERCREMGLVATAIRELTLERPWTDLHFMKAPPGNANWTIHRLHDR
jgi:hypothetical protein